MRDLFDNPPDRKATNSFKWDRNQHRFGREDIIPLWIADMDFAAPQVITQAIQKRLEHGVFGYTYRTQSYIDSITRWLGHRFDWQIPATDMLFYPPGTVAALNALVNSFSEVGDEIIVHTPAYPPLMNIIQKNQRIMVENKLICVDGQYQIDFEHLQRSFTPKTRMMLLCSPHNPTGRVWSRDELLTIANLCKENNVMVVSDEVHADLVFSGAQHWHFNHLPFDQRGDSVTIISSCKTFNIAALSQSTLICDRPKVKQKIQRLINTSQLNLDNIFSAVATEAGYAGGEPWLIYLLDYVRANRHYLVQTITHALPQVKVAEAQGTYLAWLDFRELKLSHHELERLFIERAKVGLYDGTFFGDIGEGHFRINLACAHSTLKLALDRVIQVLTQARPN